MHSKATLSAVVLKTSLCLGLLGMASCSSAGWQKAFATPTATVSYDDLGTPEMLLPVLGPRGSDPLIVVHSGRTTASTQPRKLSAHNGLLMLQRNDRALPKTPENAALRSRMRIAYSKIYQFYRSRRDAMMGFPPYVGRGAMQRVQIMPPMPPTL